MILRWGASMNRFLVAALLTVAVCGCSSDDSDGGVNELGAALYAANCASCHAGDGSGGLGPKISDGVVNDKYTFDEMVLVISQGAGSMPGFGAILSPEEIDAVTDFVRNDLESVDRPVEPTPTPAGNRTTRGAPPEIQEYAADWPLPNRDMRNTRSVLDGPIDSTTVARLEVAWRYEIEGTATFGAASTTPLILGDSIYFEDNTGMVHALDRDSGERRWVGGEGGSLFAPTGVAVGWGKVFGTKIGANGSGKYIVAYDRATGEELWATDITGNGGQVNIQASVHDGLVLAATSGFGRGVRGTISALDQQNGAIVWQFDTIESSDLWGNPDINSGGGSWYPPAVDVESNTIFYGTGNPYPFPGTPAFPNAQSRPGDNRWTSSTVALDGDTGELRWGHQPFPHDLFDRDHVHAVVGNAIVDGREREVLLTTGKGGVVFGIDPTTGDELWSTLVGRHQNDDVTEFDGPLEVLPGSQGGVLTPTSFADGVFYVATVNAPIEYKPDESSSGFDVQLFQMPSQVIAIDAADGAILWDVEVDGDAFGGTTVVNDLVITSLFTGKIIALDRDTGAEVWSTMAPGAINGWPAVAGDMVVLPVGFGVPPQLMALKLR